MCDFPRKCRPLRTLGSARVFFGVLERADPSRPAHRRRGCPAVRNPVARHEAEYCPRFGFTPASRHGVRCPFTVPDEAFMVMALVADSLDHIKGVACYPAVFDGL